MFVLKAPYLVADTLAYDFLKRLRRLLRDFRRRPSGDIKLDILLQQTIKGPSAALHPPTPKPFSFIR